MTNSRTQKDIRHYIGAAGIFLLIIFLLLFLSFNQIPPVNKDVFVSIVGIIPPFMFIINLLQYWHERCLVSFDYINSNLGRKK